MKRPSEYMTMTDGVTQHDYKRELNKYIDYLEAENKQLNLSGVGQQRKLLIAELNKTDLEYIHQQGCIDILAEDLLRAINCG